MVITAEIARSFLKTSPEDFLNEIVEEISEKIKEAAKQQKTTLNLCFNGIPEFDRLSHSHKDLVIFKIETIFAQKGFTTRSSYLCFFKIRFNDKIEISW